MKLVLNIIMLSICIERCLADKYFVDWWFSRKPPFNYNEADSQCSTNADCNLKSETGRKCALVEVYESASVQVEGFIR